MELPELERAQALVNGLFVFAKAVQLHGPRHPAVVTQGTVLSSLVERAVPPIALQFVAGGVFRARSLLPLDAQSFKRAAWLSGLLDNLERQELTFKVVPSAAALEQLALALADAHQPSSALEDVEVPGLRFREIPNARFGLESEEVDVETFVAAQLTLVLESLERAATADGWGWAAGLAAVRRLERVIEAGSVAALRIIDEMPGAWSAARLAASAGLTVGSALRAVGVSTSSRRAATHAVAVIAMTGFRASLSGAAPRDATLEALAAAVSAPVTRGQLDPHRLRTCALLQLSVQAGDAHRQGLCGLLELSYQLEQLRVRPGLSFTLQRRDLLAEAVRRLDAPYASWWVRLLVAAEGAVPAGSRVLLADGRVARVLGAGTSGDALRPEVLVGGVRLVPDGRVRLLGGSGT